MENGPGLSLPHLDSPDLNKPSDATSEIKFPAYLFIFHPGSWKPSENDGFEPYTITTNRSNPKVLGEKNKKNIFNLWNASSSLNLKCIYKILEELDFKPKSHPKKTPLKRGLGSNMLISQFPISFSQPTLVKAAPHQSSLQPNLLQKIQNEQQQKAEHIMHVY